MGAGWFSVRQELSVPDVPEIMLHGKRQWWGMWIVEADNAPSSVEPSTDVRGCIQIDKVMPTSEHALAIGMIWIRQNGYRHANCMSSKLEAAKFLARVVLQPGTFI